jgi:hypothetical protein
MCTAHREPRAASQVKSPASSFSPEKTAHQFVLLCLFACLFVCLFACLLAHSCRLYTYDNEKVMGRGGIRDILIANPLVGQLRMDRLVELRKVSLCDES